MSTSELVPVGHRPAGAATPTRDPQDDARFDVTVEFTAGAFSVLAFAGLTEPRAGDLDERQRIVRITQHINRGARHHELTVLGHGVVLDVGERLLDRLELYQSVGAAFHDPSDGASAFRSDALRTRRVPCMLHTADGRDRNLASQGKKQAPKAAAGKAARPVPARSKTAPRRKLPRDHLVDPDRFGRDPWAFWRLLPPEPDEEEELPRYRARQADYLAANTQHYLMYGIRGNLLPTDAYGMVLSAEEYSESDIKAEKMLRADIAKQLGISEDLVVRHMSGRAWITLHQAELYGAVFGGWDPPRQRRGPSWPSDSESDDA